MKAAYPRAPETSLSRRGFLKGAAALAAANSLASVRVGTGV